MNYEHRRKAKRVKNVKENKKAVIKDTLDRLNGRLVRPRCPECHKPLKAIYMTRREWIDKEESFGGRYYGAWCSCGASVISTVKPYLGEIKDGPEWDDLYGK
jgi:hypothetical protein